MVVGFGDFKLNLKTGDLTGPAGSQRLQHQPLRALSQLIESPGDLVTREDLRNRLWPGQPFGNFDNAIATTMKKLRKALGDDPDEPTYIETLPKKGYRFLADVTKNGSVLAPAEPTDENDDSLLAKLQAENGLLRSVVVDLSIDREKLRAELERYKRIYGEPTAVTALQVI